MFLNSGAVAPSSLFGEDNYSQDNAFNKTYANYPLRVGIVTKTIASTDKASVSKKYPEYNVLVYEQNGPVGGTPQLYRNCLSVQSFGNIADYFEFALRPQTKAIGKGNKIDAVDQDGALVLMLCINGQGDRGVIIGTVNHPNRKTNLKGSDLGMYFEYNGLKSSIDKDGAFNVTFKGATDSEGKVLNKDLGESTLKIEKDGSIQLNHKTITLRLDKNGNTTLAAQGAVSVQAQKTISIDAKEDISIKSAKNINLDIKDLMAKASGSATYEIQSFKLDAKSDLNLKSQRLDIKTQLATIKGTQITLDGLVFLGGAGGVPALSALTQMIGASAVGPVVSFAVGPYASKVFVS